MKKISNADLHRINPEDFRSAEKLPLIIVLDNIRSMHNVGSVFRTSDAFRVEAIWLCGITAQPPHREIEKTALGATESVQWRYFENILTAIDELHRMKYSVWGVEQVEGGTMLDCFQPVKMQPYALVFGNEVDGVSEMALGCCDGCIEIPQFGTKHSFNISVSAGIVMWHFYFHWKK